MDICKALFNKLNMAQIEYCSWKGNDHLDEGLSGKRDLDILVNKESYFEVNEILYSLKFRKYEPKHYLKYISVEDFIGLDQGSGKLVHIHLYYELRMGRKYVEDYHLPFEDYIYKTRFFSDKQDIYIIDANLDVILLIIRYALLNRKRHGDLLNKLNFYTRSISYDKLYLHTGNLLDDRCAVLITEYLRDSNDKTFNKLRKQIIVQVAAYKTSVKVFTCFTYIKRQLEAAVNYFLLKFCHLPVPYRRVNPCGGKIIVFVGVDGSGKSTMVAEIKKWYGWKIDIFTIYFGSGDGPGSIIRYPLQIAKLLRNKASDKIGPKCSPQKKKNNSFFYQVLRPLWAVTLAYEKKNKLKQAWIAKSRGLTVLCDRYPQYQTVGYNDGPLLYEWLNGKNFIARKVARWELAIYQLVNSYHPDVVIKLVVSKEVALNRKPEMTIDYIQKKIEAVNNINFSESTVVYEVDASEDLGSTLIKIKNLIW